MVRPVVSRHHFPRRHFRRRPGHRRSGRHPGHRRQFSCRPGRVPDSRNHRGYSQTEEPIRDVLTPRGLQMLDWSGHTCLLQGGVDYAFRHLEFWFNTDLNALISNDPFKSLLAAQRVGNIKPEGPVYIAHNRWDPLIPYQAARQTAADWCTMGADVELWTNEQPAFLDKTDINNLLQPYVDGERSMAWVTDRFNGVPTTPNCGQF